MGLAPVEIEAMCGFRLDLGNAIYYFRVGYTPFNDAVCASIAHNKFSANRILYQANIPVPDVLAITKIQYEKREYDLESLNYPVVIKPTWDSSYGDGVICNIKDKETLIPLLDKAFKKYGCISIEKFEKNLRSYRILVFFDKIIGIVERVPAHVIGDGIHNITQLIAIQNKERIQLEKTLTAGAIEIADETKMIFDMLGITAEYIPQKNEKMPIRYVCNAAAGGTVIGLSTQIIHPTNVYLACKAAKVLNLKLVGLDVLCEDIAKPIVETRGYFIEANSGPDITLHENAILGMPHRVSEIIVKKLISQQGITYKLKRWFK